MIVGPPVAGKYLNGQNRKNAVYGDDILLYVEGGSDHKASEAVWNTSSNPYGYGSKLGPSVIGGLILKID